MSSPRFKHRLFADIPPPDGSVGDGLRYRREQQVAIIRLRERLEAEERMRRYEQAANRPAQKR